MGAIKDTIIFEFEQIVSSLKKYDTWIFISTIFTVIFILIAQPLGAIFLLIIILVLDAARSHATGQVTDFVRKKQQRKIEDGFEN